MPSAYTLALTWKEKSSVWKKLGQECKEESAHEDERENRELTKRDGIRNQRQTEAQTGPKRNSGVKRPQLHKKYHPNPGPEPPESKVEKRKPCTTNAHSAGYRQNSGELVPKNQPDQSSLENHKYSWVKNQMAELHYLGPQPVEEIT
ncbi:hypothetical protein C8R44DRAFT_734825 [Mycena epipterygia]|nr:hypothetical protein C8R44DRAFT_734825 [Mycena epipterygia]